MEDYSQPDVVEYFDDYSTSEPWQLTSESSSLISTNSSNVTSFSGTDFPYHTLGFTAATAFIIALFGTLGNLLTIVALWMAKKLRTTATAFVINLAVVELLFCLFILPMNGAQYAYLQATRKSLLATPDCVFFAATRYTLTQVELQTVLAIALTRALAVSLPRFYLTINRPIVVGVYIAVIWLYSFLLKLPTVLGVFDNYTFNTRTMKCDLADSTKGLARIVAVIVEVIIPVALILILYVILFIMVRISSYRVARASKGGVTNPPATPSADNATFRKGSGASMQGLKKLMTEKTIRNRFARRSSSGSHHKMATNRRDLRVARTIFVIFVVIMSCSVPVGWVHIVDPTVKRPVRFLLLHVLYWTQYCLNLAVYVLMNRQYREAYIECIARVIPSFQRHRGYLFVWERPSVSSRPQGTLNGSGRRHAESKPAVAAVLELAEPQPLLYRSKKLSVIMEANSVPDDSVFEPANDKESGAVLAHGNGTSHGKENGTRNGKENGNKHDIENGVKHDQENSTKDGEEDGKKNEKGKRHSAENEKVDDTENGVKCSKDQIESIGMEEGNNCDTNELELAGSHFLVIDGKRTNIPETDI